MLEKRNIADKAEQTGVTLPDMGRIFRLYYRPLCLFALRYIPDTELSEDIVMESMESFWLKVSTPGAVSFRIMANLKSYLFVSVRNRCISELRKRRDGDESIENLSADKADTLADEAAGGCDEEMVRRSELAADLWTSIDKLPEKRRQVLVMGKRDGLSYEEISEKLGISVNTVRNHMSRALAALRHEYGDVNFVLSLLFI